MRTLAMVDFGSGLVLEKLMLKSFDEYAKLVADAYAKAPMREPGAMPHWQALKASTIQLYKRISSKVKVEFVDGQPYPDAATMKKQVEATKKLLISKDHSEHEVFGQQVNLQFRAVHDYITHIVCGQPFGLRGEIQAYNRHAKLAPPEALPALFTEVVGQACVAVTTGSFPAQKIAVLRGFDYTRIGAVVGHDIQNKQLVPQQDEPVKSVQPPSRPVPRAPAMVKPQPSMQPAGSQA